MRGLPKERRQIKLNKYDLEFDLTHDKNRLWGECKSSYCKLTIDDYPLIVSLKIKYNDFENVVDTLFKEGHGKSYKDLEEEITELEKENAELREENISLKNGIEDRDDLIEQYEEHQDALRDKYFTSDWI